MCRCLSRTLLRMLNNDIGLNLSGEVAGEDFGIGTTVECFHSTIVPGTRLVDSDRLKRLVTELAILLAVALSMQAEIASGPVALDVSR